MCLSTSREHFEKDLVENDDATIIKIFFGLVNS